MPLLHWGLGLLFATGVLCAATVATAQAPAGDFLNVVGSVPLDEQVFSDQFVVFFDKPVQLPPAADGSAQAPCSIQPPLDGASRLGPNYVAFSGKPLPQGVKVYYEVTLNPALRSADGKPLNPQQPHLFFKTFRFEVVRSTFDRSSAGETAALVLFSVPVAAESAKGFVSVVDGAGQSMATRVEQGTNAETLRIVVSGTVPADAQILFEQGLPDATGRTKLMAAKRRPFPKEEPLKVTGVEWRPGDDMRRLAVFFSGPVSDEQLKAHLSVQDASTGAPVDYAISTPGVLQSFFVKVPGSLDEPGQFNLVISAGLRGSQWGELGETYSTSLSYSPSGPEPLNLVMQEASFNEWWGGEDQEGARLYVRLNQGVDIEQVRAHLEVAPAVEGMSVQPQSDGFTVSGQWLSKQQYEIKLTPGLKCALQATDKAVVKTVRTGLIRPMLSLGKKGEYYFPRRPGLTYPLQSKNLDKAEVSLYRMFPSNIVVALSSMSEGRGSDYLTSAWSEEVAKKDVPIAKIPDKVVETPLDLDALFPQDKRGVFCLRAMADGTVEGREYRGNGDAYETVSYENRFEATKLVLWTNIAVLAHWQKNELVLFAHDLLSLTPLSMAKVSVFSAKNQTLGSANTDADGIAHLGPFDPALGEPAVAVVESENDFTFLELQARQDDERPFTEQMPRFDRKGYDAFIYADRDLYRPGEPVHARWSVRANYGDALADVPLLLTVLKPNGRSLLSQPTTLSAWGTGGIDLATEKNYPTGKYTLQLSVPGSKKTIGSYQFNVEEFVPNRTKTAVTLEQTKWCAGQTYSIVVNAQHLFGAPAAERKCEAIAIFRRGQFAPEAWKAFHFENDSDFVPEPAPCGDEVTDASGNATFQFSYQPPAAVTFPMKTIVVGRVFELGGRPVSGKAEATYFPSDVALGVRAVKAATGGIEVFAAAITPDEQAAALDKVNITLEKQVWNYYVRRYYGNHEPRWSESFQAVETREVPLAQGMGSTVFQFQPEGYGYYRVRVHSPATQQYSTLSFYSYGDGFQLADKARPSLIKVTLDKDAYQIGEEAVIRVESPFDGKGIVVIQGENIQRVIPIDIKDKAGTARFTVTREQFPNVWVEATVIHAVQTDRKQMYPFSSFAMANLSVRDPQRQLTVTYPGLPVEVRPAGEAKFDVQVADVSGVPVEAEVTLAAVDEGIHGITNYANPDPVAWLCRPRQPDFRRNHYYDKVAYDFLAPAIGGDALLRDLQKRMPSADENWVKPVSLWSGVVRTDASGRASVAMQVPEFTGQLRLVAVANTPTQLGAVGANVFVRRPYLLRASLPRFMLPGDTARSRGSVFNNTDAGCKVRVNWTSSGAIRGGTGSQEIDVAPHVESKFDATFTAGMRVGQGEVKWDVTVLDAAGQQVEQFSETAPVPVRAPAHFQSHNEFVILKPGETRELRNTTFLDDERSEIELTLGANPLLRVQHALQYAVHYPYGCVEQTTSCLMPLYLLRKNADLVETAIEKQSEVNDYVRAGIDRLMSMQTSKGGLGMWPGSNSPAEYGSVYALHFLTMVKNDREIAIPEESFRSLQGYVRGLSADWTQIDKSMLFLRAYALYVLAMDGDAEALRQIQRFDSIMIPRHARYLLAAALARNTQDKDRVRLYLASAPSEPYEVYEPYGVLNSEIRNAAIELLALRQTGERPDEALQLANKLVDFLEKRYYGTTQESAFVISALVDYLSGLAGNAQGAAATITNNGKQESLAGTGVYKSKQTGPGCAFAIANRGACGLFANVTTRGVPEQSQTAAKAEGGISINRLFRTKRGDEYFEPGFAQGDSYVVDLAISCDKDLQNVALVDMLPAGLEIENPRLDPDTLPGGAFQSGIRMTAKAKKPDEEGQDADRKSVSVTASYVDVRDDRLIVALDRLPQGQHHLYYVVRGVTPGTYQHPPASVECMYDAAVRANTSGASVEVK